MTRLRLSRAVSIVPLGTAVLVRSDLGTFRLDGSDLATLLDRVTSLLAEAAEAETVVAAMPEYDAASVRKTLDLLIGYGVVERVIAGEDPRWYGQTTFFQKFTND